MNASPEVHPYLERDVSFLRLAILGRNLVIRTTGRERELDISSREKRRDDIGKRDRGESEKERKREGQESLC